MRNLPSLVSESTVELIPLLEACRFLRIAFTQEEVDEDPQSEVVDMLINAAIKGTERYLNYDIRIRTWLLNLTSFSKGLAIVLPKYPFNTLVDVKYTDEAEDEQTLNAAAYRVTKRGNDRAVIEFIGDALPTLFDKPDAVRITFKSGTDELKEDNRLATLLAISKFYDDRSNGHHRYPSDSVRLLRNHRKGNF